jgi:acyl-lipid omega-6 desaturase (Delta-12 desaturase)
VSTTDLQKALQAFAQPDRRKAILQILDTLVPYVALYALMVVLVHEGFSYWLVLAVAVPTAAFFVRVFILFHDCCHGSFFASRKANRILGYLTGILTFTPFEQWRRSHARHHETVGDLDRRGVGDIWTMTVEEYRAAPRGKRVLYRIVRNPFAILLLGPPIVFLIGQRYFHEGDRRPERWSVVITDVALAAIVVIASLTIGLGTYLMVQLPITMIAGGAGLWLFYVQHQFEGVYWARHDVWDRHRAAMEGSSFYRLPAILRWFTGSIGFHHVHHVQQRIPNYALERCHRNTPSLQTVTPLTLLGSFRCARLHLWDEARRELAGYQALKT